MATSPPTTPEGLAYYRHQRREEAMVPDWELRKDILRTLYIVKGKSLKDIMAYMMEYYGFHRRCGA